MGVSYPEVPVLKRIRDEPHIAIHDAETAPAAAAAVADASPPCRSRATHLSSGSSSRSGSSFPSPSRDEGGFGGEKVVSEPLMAQLRLEPLRRLTGTSKSPKHNNTIHSTKPYCCNINSSVSFHPSPPANQYLNV